MFRKIRRFGTNVSKNVKGMSIGKKEKYGQEKLKLDEIDKNILRALMSDPRMSLRDIAAVTTNSVGTIRERLGKMQKHHVIRGYTAIVDPSKVGYRITAVIEIFESKKGLGLIEDNIKNMPNVCGVYSVTGSTDVIVIARFHDSDELNDFVRKILRMKNVSRTETLIVLDTYKEDFRPMV
jgi:Lrp/AsnC family transcriptional regulator, regulator for asnA, asnC and gidA